MSGELFHPRTKIPKDADDDTIITGICSKESYKIEYLMSSIKCDEMLGKYKRVVRRKILSNEQFSKKYLKYKNKYMSLKYKNK
jgi:hypothetical protein